MKRTAAIILWVVLVAAQGDNKGSVEAATMPGLLAFILVALVIGLIASLYLIYTLDRDQAGGDETHVS